MMPLKHSIIDVASLAVQIVAEVAKALRSLTDQWKPCHLQDAIQIDCRQSQLQLEVNVAKTMSWYNLWFMDTDKSDDLFQALWGQAGHNAILQVLQSITKECEALKCALDLFITHLDAQVRKSKAKRTNSWKKVPKFLHLSTKWVADANPGQEIHDGIRTLTGYVDDLWARSELHFRRLHGVPRGLHSRPHTAYADGRVGHAVATRPATSALYWSLQSCTTQMELELNLLNHDQDVDVFSDLFGWSDLKLSYHILLEVETRHEKQIDLVAELFDGTRPRGVRPLHVVEDVMVAVKSELYDSSADFLLRCPRTAEHNDISFHIKIEADVERRATHPVFFDTMADSMNVSSPNCVDLNTLEAKMTLAYRIVESSLFLLGTPWLSHLKSDTVRGSRITKLDQRYSLHISTSSQKSITASTSQDAEPAQIFRIGMILLEIGLGRRVFDETPTGTPDSVLMDSVAAVGQTMGVPYKKACEFCLTQKGEQTYAGPIDGQLASLISKTTSEPMEMINLFYTEVFMRLRDEYTS